VANVLGGSLDGLAEDFLEAHVSQLQESWALLNLEIESRTWDTKEEALEVIARLEPHLLHLEEQGDEGLPPGRFVVLPVSGERPDAGRWEIRHVSASREECEA
jgi:hypothetical protein